MGEGRSVGDDHEIRYSLGRREWARTEWPALVFWVAPPLLILLGIAAATIYISAWWAVTLPVWLVLGGVKAMGLLVVLVRGSTILLRVKDDGTIFVGENDSEPVYGHWVGFVDEGETIVLWGGDGRYRLVIPKRALTSADYAVLHRRAGVDLESLEVGQEARIQATAHER